MDVFGRLGALGAGGGAKIGRLLVLQSRLRVAILTASLFPALSPIEAFPLTAKYSAPVPISPLHRRIRANRLGPPGRSSASRNPSYNCRLRLPRGPSPPSPRLLLPIKVAKVGKSAANFFTVICACNAGERGGCSGSLFRYRQISPMGGSRYLRCVWAPGRFLRRPPARQYCPTLSN